jgi:hypothetical protein
MFFREMFPGQEHLLRLDVLKKTVAEWIRAREELVPNKQCLAIKQSLSNLEEKPYMPLLTFEDQKVPPQMSPSLLYVPGMPVFHFSAILTGVSDQEFFVCLLGISSQSVLQAMETQSPVGASVRTPQKHLYDRIATSPPTPRQLGHFFWFCVVRLLLVFFSLLIPDACITQNTTECMRPALHQSHLTET